MRKLITTVLSTAILVAGLSITTTAAWTDFPQCGGSGQNYKVFAVKVFSNANMSGSKDYECGALNPTDGNKDLKDDHFGVYASHGSISGMHDNTSSIVFYVRTSINGVCVAFYKNTEYDGLVKVYWIPPTLQQATRPRIFYVPDLNGSTFNDKLDSVKRIKTNPATGLGITASQCRALDPNPDIPSTWEIPYYPGQTA